jgi:hypothetical protein
MSSSCACARYCRTYITSATCQACSCCLHAAVLPDLSFAEQSLAHSQPTSCTSYTSAPALRPQHDILSSSCTRTQQQRTRHDHGFSGRSCTWCCECSSRRKAWATAATGAPAITGSHQGVAMASSFCGAPVMLLSAQHPLHCCSRHLCNNNNQSL